jgi:riboflavin synthase
MFTGLIETVGTVVEAPAGTGHLRVRGVPPGVIDGESIAVNGVCLTVTGVAGDEVRMDVGPETARVTALGRLRAGGAVNLERAMRADGRFGGHLVQGHVDGTGVLEETRIEGEARWLAIAYPSDLAPFLIPRGAVAVEGVSLTVARLAAERFEVMIVPFTWAHTALSTLTVGDRVNLECDMVGKYVVRAAAAAAQAGPGMAVGTERT